MRFRSTNSNELSVTFKDAVLRCLPEDGGLYVPDKAMDIRQLFLYMDENTSFPDLVAAVAPSPAPAATPSRYGSASGFRKIPW